MKVVIKIKYLGKTTEMVVDYDDERLSDESYEIGRQINMDSIVNDFWDNAQVEFELDR